MPPDELGLHMLQSLLLCFFLKLQLVDHHGEMAVSPRMRARPST
jgi:hypothetical protein